MPQKRSTITRRAALQLLAAMGALSSIPSHAFADTQTDLADAQARLAAAQAELDAIANEYEALSIEQSHTLDEMEEVESQIDKLSRRIARTEKELASKQEELSHTVSEEYKDGNTGVVDLLLRSGSVEDLISNFYYYEKITTQQADLIQDVKDTRESFLVDKTELEAQEVMLEEVSKTQQGQLDAMRNKQLEAQQVIDGLDQEVKDLVAKRDAELLAAQQEAERARKERETAEQAMAEAEAQKQAQEQSSANTASATDTAPVSSAADESGSVEETYASGSGSAAKVIAACHSTPSPGLGLCAGWCSNVMINAGYGFVAGNANDMYASFCHSSNRSDLKPGMAVAVSSHPHTSAGRIYGHIGMYIGNGTMMDNIGYIRTISVDEWCSFYGATVTPRWGWLNNIVLT